MKKNLLISTLVIFILFIAPAAAHALYEFGDGEAVGIRVDVSSDNGTTWHNFDSNENPGEEIIYVSPGDTLIFRGTTWNAGASHLNPTFEAILTGSDYFTDFINFNDSGTDDIDGNNNYYFTGEFFNAPDNDGTTSFDVYLNQGLPTSSDLENAEVGAISVTLANDIPNNTLITGIFLVDGEPSLFELASVNSALSRLFPSAYAAEPGVSLVSIVVLNPESENLPDLTVLPKTGRSQ
jgi:hypothetical protein